MLVFQGKRECPPHEQCRYFAIDATHLRWLTFSAAQSAMFHVKRVVSGGCQILAWPRPLGGTTVVLTSVQWAAACSDTVQVPVAVRCQRCPLLQGLPASLGAITPTTGPLCFGLRKESCLLSASIVRDGHPSVCSGSPLELHLPSALRAPTRIRDPPGAFHVKHSTERRHREQSVRR